MGSGRPGVAAFFLGDWLPAANGVKQGRILAQRRDGRMSGILENAVRDKAALREMVEQRWPTLKVLTVG